MSSIIIIGPGHPLRGGLATFNQRLAAEFIKMGHDCSIWSFSLQYPSFLFPGKTQYSDAPAPEGIQIYPAINSINPINWVRVGNKIKKIKPDLVIVRFWLPFMGPALGTIIRKIRKNKHTRIVCIADNIIPHEKRAGDKAFTKYFLKGCDAFITMSDKVMNDLRGFEKEKPAKLVAHPLYDNFGASVEKQEARKILGLDPGKPLMLFFGFIRHYKGLDILFDAIKLLREKWNNGPAPLLLVAGEFYEDEKTYREQIEKLVIADQLILRTDFIPDDEVKYYLSAADVLIQPYRSATQSGVSPLAYHFEKPMIVTNVGGLPEMVPDGKSGLVVNPDPTSIADAIIRFYQLGEQFFIPHLREEKQKYSWSELANAFLNI